MANGPNGASGANGSKAKHGTHAAPAAQAGAVIGRQKPRLRFGDFLLDLQRAELSRAGQPVALRPKALALLSELVARAGCVVTKEELLAAVWPDVVVTDDSLTQCVAEVRAALGDRGGQAFIHTLPRLGYRFDMPVVSLTDERQGEAAAEAPQSVPVGAVTTAPVTRRASRGWRRYTVAAGIGLLAIAAVAMLPPAWRGGQPLQHIDAELAARRSIAVMPFADRSEQPAPYIAEAVAEEILTDVARMRNTLVVSSGSTRALAARGLSDPAQVGRELGVQFVLSGSIQRDAERLRINVQLSRTVGAAVVWSERFDHDIASERNWRSEVSARIAGTLDVKLHEAALDPVWHAGRSSQAMDQWMRGEDLLRRYKTHQDILRAREHFEAALAAEPRSVNALVGLARTHHVEVLRRWRGGRGQAESLARAKASALAALAIDPNHAGALAALGVIESFANNFEDAERALTKALAVNPNDANAHRDLAVLKLFTGRFEEIPAHIAAALRLNPLESFHVVQCHSILGNALSYMNRAGAEDQFRLATLADPTNAGPHGDMAAQVALRGHLDEARLHLAEALRLRPGWTITKAKAGDRSSDPRYLAGRERQREGLRLAGLPEGIPEESRVGVAGADATRRTRQPTASQ